VGKSDLQAEIVRVLWALRSLQSKNDLAVEKRRERHFCSSEEQEKWINDYVERETCGARERGEAAEAAIRQEQEVMETPENWGLTTREHEKSLHEMTVAVGDSLSDISSFDDGQDWEDENDEETEQSKLSEVDEPGWVMGTMSKMVHHRMERFPQKQMKLDELTQTGLGDSADYFC